MGAPLVPFNVYSRFAGFTTSKDFIEIILLSHF